MARPTPWAALLLAAVACLGSAAAQAQAQGARRQEADRRQRALDLLDEGSALYDAGRFAEAAERLRAAHALHPEPALLYNLARALDSAGEHAQAIDAYGRYLEADPEAPRRAAVEARVAVLRQQLPGEGALEGGAEQAQGEPEERALEPEQREASARGRSLLGPVLVLSAGGAAVAAGLVAGILADGRLDAARDAPDHRTRLALEDEAGGIATAANVLFVVGGVLAAAGLTWFLVESGPGDGGEPGVSVSAAPGAAMATVRARF